MNIFKRKKLVDKTIVYKIDFVFRRLEAIEEHVYDYTDFNKPAQIKVIYKNKTNLLTGLGNIYAKISQSSR